MAKGRRVVYGPKKPTKAQKKQVQLWKSKQFKNKVDDVIVKKAEHKQINLAPLTPIGYNNGGSGTTGLYTWTNSNGIFDCAQGLLRNQRTGNRIRPTGVYIKGNITTQVNCVSPVVLDFYIVEYRDFIYSNNTATFANAVSSGDFLALDNVQSIISGLSLRNEDAMKNYKVIRHWRKYIPQAPIGTGSSNVRNYMLEKAIKFPRNAEVRFNSSSAGTVLEGCYQLLITATAGDIGSTFNSGVNFAGTMRVYFTDF